MQTGKDADCEVCKVKVKQIKDIDTAIRIYYMYPEIGKTEIRELVGNIGNSTISNYTKAVKEEQVRREKLTAHTNTVDTETAYAVWGIDVEDLIKRRAKLQKLKLA